MTYPTCRHIHTRGVQCGSPALSGRGFCFFHQNLHDRHQVFHRTAGTPGYLLPGQHVELPALEDREAVQLALSVVINALATGQLETRRATALLYGLQLAGMNARPYTPFTNPERIVRELERESATRSLPPASADRES